ncbi:unnamed protein product [Phytophthora lilii]|uniref:Unnamed protein product n=1 Tax=Phytophthora lilii TaxID=2077276 RepID=A0A9W7CUC1_9STRA|nr:unnamed protein product [Phytophthora lilii]
MFLRGRSSVAQRCLRQGCDFLDAQMEAHFKHLSLSLVAEILASVPRIKDGYNPATWILEAGVADAGDKQPTEDVDFVKIFNASASKKLLDEKLTETGIFLPSETVQSLQYGKKRAASKGTQLPYPTSPLFQNVYRLTTSHVWQFSLILGLIIWNSYIDTVYQGINSGLGMVFLSTVFIGIIALINYPWCLKSVLPFTVSKQRRHTMRFGTLWVSRSSFITDSPTAWASH